MRRLVAAEGLLLGGLGAGLSHYWASAPDIFKVAAPVLFVVAFLDGAVAARYCRVFPDAPAIDGWRKATERLAIHLAIILLCICLDHLSGSPYSFGVASVLFGCGKHVAICVRHLQRLAAEAGTEVPGYLPAEAEGLERRGGDMEGRGGR